MSKNLLLIFIMLLPLKGYTVTFEEITAADKAVIRFTATWCGPCKSFAPIFDEVAAEHPEVKTFVVDADENPEILQRFGVRGIPTVFRIESGSVKLQRSGVLPKPELEKFFE